MELYLEYMGKVAVPLLAVVIGGSAGCVLRWLFAMRFNALFPNLPPGTLLVNLIGGLVIRLGDHVVDSSIRTKLDGLKRELFKVSA